MLKKQDNFIKGPIRIDILAGLIETGPPSALHTYLVLLFVAGLRKSDRIIPNYRHAKSLGLKSRSFRRGLVILQEKGIIIVRRGPGVKPVIELL